MRETTGKRYWAIMIKRSLLGALVIFLVGVLYDYLSVDPEYRSPVTAGFVAIAIYLVSISLLGILNLISGALYLWIFAEKDLTDAMLDDLRNAQLRAPLPHEPKTQEYLSCLATDDESDIDQRLKAATLLGGYNAAMSNGLFRSLAIRKAIDNAVLRYSQEAPER